MTVYVCTSGEYSDYGIDAIFTDKEQAEMYCAIHEDDRDCPTVVEWDTDEVKIEPCASIKRLWIVHIKSDGTVYLCESRMTLKNRNRIDTFGCTPAGNSRSIRYRVFATLDKDIPEEQALKIIFDKLAKYKAEHCGI